MTGGVLSRMVHDDNGGIELALQLTQKGEQCGYLARIVLVDAVQTHEGVEQQESGPKLSDRLAQADFCLVLGRGGGGRR